MRRSSDGDGPYAPLDDQETDYQALDERKHNILQRRRKRSILIPVFLSCGLTAACVLMILFIAAAAKHHVYHCELLDGISPCCSKVYCRGSLLRTVQESGVFNDSKTFVDMPCGRPQSEILAAKWSKKPSTSELETFLSTYFLPDGSDLVELTPTDWQPSPSFLQSITSPELRAMGIALHAENLTRAFVDATPGCDDCCNSSLSVPHPFVVAGGRFREFYYWDSFWIIRGLLVSGMTSTARGMILNFLSLIEQYGFVPNGGRVYYLNRSQLPLLTQMIAHFVSVTGENELLTVALPLLDREYRWWMERRSVKVRGYTLNNYAPHIESPRPEGYHPDVVAASHVKGEKAKQELWSNLAAAAESGWDFSSRWLGDEVDVWTAQTSSIIPVDLNSVLYANELTLAQLFAAANNQSFATFYNRAAAQRKQAMSELLWEDSASVWLDYSLSSSSSNNNGVLYPSSLYPLWAQAYDDATLAQTAVTTMSAFLLDEVGGVPASSKQTEQQWDYPNAWAPLQWFVVEGLLALASQSNNNDTYTLARTLQQRFVSDCYCAWVETSLFFEKYDCRTLGGEGGGGEYAPQSGFGWTNGVLLEWLQRDGDILQAPQCPSGARR